MANKKISQLPLATSPLSRIAPIPTVQGGVTVKTPSQDVAGKYIGHITLTSAEILLLNTTPILAVAAPGNGYFIRITSASAVMKQFNTTPYATSTILELKTETATRPQFTFVYILQANSPSPGEMGVLQDFTAANSTQLIENKAVYLQTFVALNPTAGDSDIDVYFTFEIIAL